LFLRFYISFNISILIKRLI